LVSEESISILRRQLAEESPTPETMQLFQTVWDKSSEEGKIDLLALVGLPSTEEIAVWRDDDQLHIRLLRQWRWLAGVAVTLPEPWASAHQQLVHEFGEGDPEARRYATRVQVGSVSPLDVEEVARLGPDALATWLASWEPPPDRWAAPTPNGLAVSIREVVKNNPEPWIAALPELVERLHHPSYVRGVIGGVRDALEDPDLSIDWHSVLPALDLVSRDPWPVETLTEDPFDADRDWSETHRETVRLLERALERDAPFDEEQLGNIWALLVRLMTKGQNEASHISEGARDLVELAINKDSTVALRAMFLLALSASRRGLTNEDWGSRLVGVVREELELGGIEARLAGAIAASLFPQFIHVSGDRALGLIPTLFGEPVPDRISTEMLETLLKYSRPLPNDLLARFYPYLETYFRTVPVGDGDAERSSVRWLLIGYLRQIPGQSDPDTLLELLAEPSRISEAAEFYGRVLRESKGAPAELGAALRFWDAFLEKERPPDASLGFGWWAEGNALPDDQWLERILPTLRRSAGRIDWDHAVVERLSRLKDSPPAWEALALLVRGAEERWTVAYWSGTLLRLFEESQESAEPIRSLRSELAEALLERELLDFRRFVRLE
jgi:hypothetical protein